MKKMIAFFLAAMFVVCCSDKDSKPTEGERLPSPHSLAAEQLKESLNVKLTWEYAGNPVGFTLLLRDSEDLGNIREIATVAASDRSYIFEDLEMGHNYYLGVRADAADAALSSKPEYLVVYVADPTPAKLPRPVIVSAPAVYPNAVAVSYAFENMANQKKLDWGLCWNTAGEPDIEDDHCSGPQIQSDEVAITQIIPNVKLEYGRDYKIRAYLTVASGTNYSETEWTVRLEDEPQGIELPWQKQSVAGLPEDVEFYACTTELNGRPLNAWYAVADLSRGNVEFRAQVPASLATVDAQFTSDCYVLTNAAFFYNGRNLGFSSVQGSRSGSISAVRGSLRTSDEEYSQMYNVTRGVFGVDADQKAAVYWAGTDSQSTTWFYDSPMPSCKGLDKYSEPSRTYPVQSCDWEPYYALTAGPVLVKNGRCIPDFTELRQGGEYFVSNYEIIPYDIYNIDTSPDRTAVGVRADGKIVLFVCDGRITASKGATITELAAIMKGLGCVDAVNFDGGGSTAMVVMGNRVNSTLSNTSGATENRPVASTMGFFKKK